MAAIPYSLAVIMSFLCRVVLYYVHYLCYSDSGHKQIPHVLSPLQVILDAGQSEHFEICNVLFLFLPHSDEQNEKRF